MPDEHVLRIGIVENAETGPDDSFALPGNIPGHAEARRPVLVIRLVKAALAHRENFTGRGINVGEHVVLFLDDPEIVIAQAEIEGETPREANTVLQIKSVRVLEGVAIGATGSLGTSGRGAR